MTVMMNGYIPSTSRGAGREQKKSIVRKPLLILGQHLVTNCIISSATNFKTGETYIRNNSRESY